MNELIEKANQHYSAEQWEEARKGYISVIDNYIYDVPLLVIVRLAIAQRMLGHLDSSEKTILFGIEKYSMKEGLLVEYAALENSRKNWGKAVERWELLKSKYSKMSMLNYKRYAHALQQLCLSKSKNINDKANEKECTKLRELIKEAFSVYGEDKALKKILDTLKITDVKKK